MSFRCRQKLILANCQSVMEVEPVTLESGEIISQAKDLCKEKLPDPELFELKNQLQAGIDIEEVNSKVLKPSVVDANTVVRKYSKRSKNVQESDNY